MSENINNTEMLEDDFNPIDGQTPTSLINEIAKKVKNSLESEYPDYIEYDEHTFTVEQGSTVVMISVRPFNEEEISIEFFSQVLTGCDIDKDLMSFLLRKNADLNFGAFGMLFDNTITFSHSITGSDMNESEFLNSLKAVGLISDHYDDKIAKYAGGKRACELTNEELLESLY